MKLYGDLIGKLGTVTYLFLLRRLYPILSPEKFSALLNSHNPVPCQNIQPTSNDKMFKR